MAGPHPGQQGRALDQLVAGQRVEAAGRRALELVVGPPHPLEEGADGPRRADLAHQLHRADVDAQLERGGGHQGPQVAGPEPLLDDPPAGRRQAAVVGGHLQGGVDRVDAGDRGAGRRRWPPASSGEPRRMASWWATRSAILRVLTKTSVVRCSSTCSAIRSSTSASWGPLATASSSLSGSSMATSRSRR